MVIISSCVKKKPSSKPYKTTTMKDQKVTMMMMPTNSLLQFQNPIRSIIKAKHFTLLFTITFLVITYFLYTLMYIFSTFHHATSPSPCTTTTTNHNPFTPPNPSLYYHLHHHIPPNPNNTFNKTSNYNKTQLHHIVFGIAASENLWQHRKEYIKLWWRPNETRGYVWLDKPVIRNSTNDDINDIHNLPPLRISSDTSRFKYTNKEGDRSAIRISRIVSETVRLGLDDVRWIVMGDDDTVFVVENLVRVLEKYDHREYYYIGSSSESHMQNIKFSYNMAFGGGGFAISYPLAKVLEKIQDECLHRYPGLYGSDDRIQACMAEIGIPLTKEIGFHQFDLYGNIFGYLSTHPVAPLVSLHHLDKIEPIFPEVEQAEALERLKVPMKLDSAALMQQSICYDQRRRWTVSVSWGYAVQILRGMIPPREMERPTRTFVNWYPEARATGYPFNTRPAKKSGCTMPFLYVLSNALYNPSTKQTASEYVLYVGQDPECDWRMADPSEIQRVEVYKKPNPNLWDKSPRRNCCRILPSRKKGTMMISVGECSDFEH